LVSNTVAVLLAGLNPFYLSMLRAIEDIAAERGTLVLMADTRDSSTIAAAVIRRLVARGVDGIIAVSAGGVENTAPRGRGQQTSSLPPIVHVDQPDRKGYSVVFNGEQAGYLATRHLMEHGHRAIGFITAPLSWPNAREIHAGYVRALAETAGHPLVSEAAEFTVEAGRRAMGRLLDASTPPTAVFAAGEVFTVGVVQEARARGLELPSQLAVIGYTDYPTATLMQPPLTMVSVPAGRAGAKAMRTLQALIAGTKPSPQRIVLDTELVIRASCGPH
jgi:DNA-binding LacI/PurR family transcriptional regulator